MFEKYEFGSLRKYLGNIKPTVQSEAKRLDFKEASIEEVCHAAEKDGCCAIIIESDGSGIFADIKKITVSAGTGKESCIVAAGRPEDFAAMISNPSIEKYGYDLKLQRNLLAHAGLKLEGRLMDIELMHYLINPEKSHKIDILTKTYLDINIEDYIDSQVDKAPLSLFDEVPEEEPESNFAQVAATLLLGRKIWEEMEDMALQSLYLTMEEPLLKVLSKMEQTGVKIDLAQLRKYSSALAVEMNEIQDKVRESAADPNLNILSPIQIGTLIFEKLKLDPSVKPKKGVRYSYPTDEDTLSALADKHPIINQILEYRAVRKLLSTYIDPLPGYVSPTTGKIHTTFNQALTATGRLSSSKPNLQNIPIRTERGKEIRKAFIPSREDGLIVSADYSQIELRIMAHLSCDSHLINAFRNGQDVHAITAAKIFGIEPEEVTSDQRRIAKTANFGIMYGISAFGLSQRLGISRQEAKKIIDDYFEKFPAISSFIDDTLAAARENGYVETLFGRRRYLPDINSKNGTVRSLAERTAINAPIQGTSADIIKLAMINLDKRLKKEGLKSRMILQIHDELIVETAPDEVEIVQRIVQEEMEAAASMKVKLSVEAHSGKTWFDAK